MPYIDKMYGIYLGDLSGKLFEMKDLRKSVSNLLDRTIDKLIEMQIRYFDEQEETVARNWSIWLINTSTHIAIIASQEDLGESIPEDGSFISGIRIEGGLTESVAKVRVNELGKSFGLVPKDEKLIS